MICKEIIIRNSKHKSNSYDMEIINYNLKTIKKKYGKLPNLLHEGHWNASKSDILEDLNGILKGDGK